MDDVSAIETLPRNSISLLNSTVSDIHNFSMDRNMRLNPIKCKEMLINFRQLNSNFTLRPLVVGNNAIERVSTYMIRGVLIILSIATLSGTVMLTTYIKMLARSSTPYVFYVEPALIKVAW